MCENLLTIKKTHHLQQSQISGTDVVKVDLEVLPAGAVVHQVQAVRLVVDDVQREDLVRGGVDAVVVLPCEQVDAHDAEDKPEDEADQQHVHDGGDGAQQRVHHNLERSKRTGQSQRSPVNQVVVKWPLQSANHLTALKYNMCTPDWIDAFRGNADLKIYSLHILFKA